MILEIALGIVLGFVLLRFLPQILSGAVVLISVLAIIAAGALVVASIYWHWERILGIAAMLAAMGVGSITINRIETISRHSIDELVIIGLSLAAIPLFAWLFAWAAMQLVAKKDNVFLAMMAIAVAIVSACLLVVHLLRKRAAKRVALSACATARVVEGEVLPPDTNASR